MPDPKKDWSLWLVLTGCVAAILVIGFLLELAFRTVRPDDLAAGMTNVATIGGIVSGLSLSGTAVLTLSGRYTLRILEKYGSAIRFVLFGGFALLVTASLLCALAVMWSSEDWARYVLAFTVPVMLVTLVTTALLINNAFGWEKSGATGAPKANPYKSQK